MAIACREQFGSTNVVPESGFVGHVVGHSRRETFQKSNTNCGPTRSKSPTSTSGKSTVLPNLRTSASLFSCATLWTASLTNVRVYSATALTAALLIRVWPANGVVEDEKNSCRIREIRCGGIWAVAESPRGGTETGEGEREGGCVGGRGRTFVDLPPLEEAACRGLLGLCFGGIDQGKCSNLL